MTRTVPMFPLGSVLFPYTALPLHVFEPRYRVLMFDCTRGARAPEFGVVLIERGVEVGGSDERFRTGTLARIVTAGELPDGRWVLETIGTSRIRVAQWLPDDPYPLAEVVDMDDPSWSEQDDEPLETAERVVRRALSLTAELGEPAVAATVELADEHEIAAWQLAAIAPLGRLDQQRLLETDGHGARLRLLAEMAEEQITVLAYRLAGG